jgi:hypothetical protein
LCGADRADAGSCRQLRCGLLDEPVDVGVVVADLGVQLLPAAWQRGQGEAGAVDVGEAGAGSGEIDYVFAVDAGPGVVVEFEDEAAQLQLGLGAGLDARHARS